MTPTPKQRATDREERMQEAKNAASALRDSGSKVNRQLSLGQRLVDGWRRVHERNHLAQLFRDEGKLG